jgi:hypothetical protein
LEDHLLDNPIYASDVDDLIHRKQFSMQLADDRSILQFFYQYDSRESQLHKARLGYYCAQPNTEISKISSEVESDESASRYVEQLTSLANKTIGKTQSGGQAESVIDSSYSIDGPVNWIRIDYDPSEIRGILHHSCHMHISFFTHSRIVVSGIPSPRQFTEFVLATFYPDIYRQHRLDHEDRFVNQDMINSFNEIHFPPDDVKLCSQVVHIRIPSNT